MKEIERRMEDAAKARDKAKDRGDNHNETWWEAKRIAYWGLIDYYQRELGNANKA